MSNEPQFIDGLIVKPPHANAPDFVKASLSIKRAELIKWLSAQTGDWVNVEVKESHGGKWYASVNEWKPEGRQQSRPVRDCPQPDQGAADFADDDVPFSPLAKRQLW